jgi:hypothetical protein
MNKTPAPIPKGRIAVSVHNTTYLTIWEDSRLRSRSSIQDALWRRGPRRRRVLRSVVRVTASANPKRRARHLHALCVSRTPTSECSPDSSPSCVCLLPLVEYRILQAQEAAGNPARPTMSRQGHDPTASHPDRSAPGILATHPQSESDVGSESSQSRADRAVPEVSQAKSGTSSADSNSGPRPGPEPTTQRTRDDGRVPRET